MTTDDNSTHLPRRWIPTAAPLRRRLQSPSAEASLLRLVWMWRAVLSLLAGILLLQRMYGSGVSDVGSAGAMVTATVLWAFSFATYVVPLALPLERPGTLAGLTAVVPPLMVGGVLLPSPDPVAVGYLAVLLATSCAGIHLTEQPGPAVADAAPTRLPPIGTDGVEQATPDETAQPSAKQSPRADESVDESAALAPSADQRSVEEAPTGPTRLAEFEDATRCQPDEAEQWLARHHLPDGSEAVEGVTRAVMAARQKDAHVHLAFAPPLAAVPEVECEVVNDCDAEVRVAAAYPWGVRLHVHRSEADEQAVAEIGFRAVAAQPGSRVA